MIGLEAIVVVNLGLDSAKGKASSVILAMLSTVCIATGISGLLRQGEKNNDV